MIVKQRSAEILKLLMDGGAMSVSQLAERLDVSEMTIRRDLAKLKKDGAVRLVNGVAFCSKGSEPFAYDLAQQLGVNCRAKDAIGRVAASLLVPGDSVFIDCGSTASAMFRYIPRDLDITIICSTFNALAEAKKKNVTRLVFTGGFYHAGTETFESPEAIEMLRGMRSSKAFITAAGASMELGLTCMEQYETAIKQVAMETGMQKILLVDSSKFSRVSPAFFGAWSSIDAVVTDEGIPDCWKDFFAERNIDLKIAEQENEA